MSTLQLENDVSSVPAKQVAEIQAFISRRIKKLGMTNAELARRTDRSYELIHGVLRGEQKNGGSVLVLLEMLQVIGCGFEIRESVR